MKGYTTKEFAALVPCAPTTLERWESIGIFKAHHRNERNHRVYLKRQLARARQLLQERKSKKTDIETSATIPTTETSALITTQTPSAPAAVVPSSEAILPEPQDGKKITPSTEQGAPIISPNKSTAIIAQGGGFVQHLENLPDEIFSAPRFFKVNPDKTPPVLAWNQPNNQKLCTAINNSLVGFDISGHGRGEEYALIDADHVLIPNTNEFVTELAKSWCLWLIDTLNPCYCERSISGDGLHIIIKPTPDKFKRIVNKDGEGVLYLDKNFDAKSTTRAKIEIFHKQSARYCLLTGNLFETTSRDIPSGNVADHVLETLLTQIKLQYQAEHPTPKKKTADTYKEFPQDIRDLINRINTTIKPADLEAKNLLHRSEHGAPYPTGFICIWCGSGEHEHKTGALTWYETPTPHFTCHARSCGGDIIKFLSKVYGIDNHGKDFYTLLKKIADEFAIAYDQKIFEPRTFAAMDVDQQEPELLLTTEQRAFLYSGDFTDDDFAQRILYLHGEQIRYLQQEDSWLIFNRNSTGGAVWNNGGEKNSVLYPFATDLSQKLIINAHDDEDARKLGYSLKSTKKKSSAIAAIKGFKRVIIKPEDLDKHKNLLNCRNGVVDLETGKLLDADPSLLLTQQSPANYDPNAISPTVIKFLSDVLPDPETLDSVMRYFGYCATGEVVMHKALFIGGNGRNGKGTFLRLIMNTLGVDFATSLAAETFLIGKLRDSGAPSPELMKLKYRRLAVIEEIPANRQLDVARFKNLTGGDRVDARELHKPYEKGGGFDPTHKFVFCGNVLPQTVDVDSIAFRERLLNVVFKQSFAKNPDTTLPSRLAQQECIDAMLAILVEQAGKWYRDNTLPISAEMKAATQNYIAENDFIAEFISEECAFAPEFQIRRKDFEEHLKLAYPRQCRQFRPRELSELITRKLKPHGVTSSKDRKGMVTLIGVKLHDDLRGSIIGTDVACPD